MKEIDINKILICRIGWMEKYDGFSEIYRGGSFIDENGYGYESFNFKPHNGKMYGYVQPPPTKIGNYFDVTLHIERLRSAGNNPVTKGILVVWVASKDSATKVHIIGWYRNAEVFRKCQFLRGANDRLFPDIKYSPYRMTANPEECVLLSFEERMLSPIIPKGENGMGRANNLYPNINNIEIRTKIKTFIENYYNK